MVTEQPFTVHVGDAITHMLEDMGEASVPLCITSVPFPAMYAYTDSEADLGNAEGLDAETRLHFGWFFRGLRRVLMPGRAACVHCMQVPFSKRSGREGLWDFRGFLIRLGVRAGLVYEYDWHVRKNPQSQAIRTHSHQLQFAGLEKDRANSRGALGDYVIKFRAPGTNATPIAGDGSVTRDDWIAWAEGSWSDIKETDTLNTRAAKRDDDTRHICPLQLGLIARLVRLYSLPGEAVFDPFMGIGSVAREAVRLGRRAYGCELRADWAEAARKNVAAVVAARESQKGLFDGPKEAP